MATTPAGKAKAEYNKIKKSLDAALERGEIDRATYNSRLAAASNKAQETSGFTQKISEAGKTASTSAKEKRRTAKRLETNKVTKPTVGERSKIRKETNARDTAAMREDLAKIAKEDAEKSRGYASDLYKSKEAAKRIASKTSTSTVSKPNLTARQREVLAKRAGDAAKKNTQIMTRQARGLKYGKSYELLSKLGKGASTVGEVASKAAGPLGVAAGLYDAASTLADKKKLASAAVGRKAVMDAAAGKMNKSDNMYDTAAKAKKAALAKKAAAAKTRGTMIPADRGSRGKNASRTYTEGRRADNMSPRAPGAKSTSNASKAPSGASTHVVKRGDTLWDIAQANNTTVSTLLKLNPQIAQRKAEGKTTIFSGSKVRIPKGK